MRNRWTPAEAWAWYDARPWVMGIDYVPSICVGGELWQDDLHDEVMRTVRGEIALMQSIGINGVRMFLPFGAWYLDHDGFFAKMDELLDALGDAGITLMPVIFNDCVGFDRPDDPTPKKAAGWPQYDIGHHGGHKRNPFTGEKNRVGWCLWDEPDFRGPLLDWLAAMVGRYARDGRIYAWDLWNEPGGSNRREMSRDYLITAFETARGQDPIQPLTAGPWRYDLEAAAPLEPIARLALDLSDIVTFHLYGKFDEMKAVIALLEREGRPMMNTEWLNRVLDNTIFDNLPLFHEKRIGSYSWGLVAGKMQHFLPWDELYLRPELPLRRWQHDLFDTYHTPYDPEEIALMKKLRP